MRPVIPTYVTYDTGPVRPSLENMTLTNISVLIFASLQWNTVTLNIMPTFRPNKLMLDMHKDKGK